MTTSAVTTWRYHLPSVNCEGWAIAFLDSIGCFSVLSDYGDYGHRWPFAWGPGDFREGFLRFGDDYILRKIARQDHYDGELTLRSVKARICELRRHGSWNRAKARQEWDLLARCDHLYSREGFGRWYERTSMDDAGEESVYTHAPQAQGFVTHCLPRLREAIRAELAREKGVAA